jgi:tetratricopeptide (TPR) repeat protein
MEQLALPGTIRLTAETQRLAEGYVDVKSLGPIPVKGLSEPIEVFELAGIGSARTRLQAAAARGFTRFVGRDAELEHLHRVLNLASTGRGQVVALVGEAGVGKSRLIHEFTRSRRVPEWLVLHASSVSYGRATSYLPVVDLLKGYFGIGSREDHREMQEKVLGRVLGLDSSLEFLLSPLLALLDVPVNDAAWNSLHPHQRRSRTLDAVKQLLMRESQAQPLLVVFEDLHWIDGETQALLDSLVEGVSSARLLLLVNYRPEYEHRWGSKTTYSQLRLDSLSTEGARQLLSSLLGPEATGLMMLTQMLVKRGNPFFLEETVRNLIEAGPLAGERGALRLTRPLEALHVPATVQTILAARIDRLPTGVKDLLQAAAAIGKNVSYPLLAAIVQRSEKDLRREIAHLQEAEFLYETQLFPDLEYTFKHALTHEVAYGGLLQSRRRQLHARITVAIEQLYPERLSEHVEQLAYHAHRGSLWEQAVRYGRQAGNRALNRSAARDALVAFGQARVALTQLTESRERTEQLIDICLDERLALFALGEIERLGNVLEEGRSLAEGLGDQRRLGWVFGYAAQRHSILGEYANAIAAGQRACAIGEATGEPELLVVANYYLGLAFWAAGLPTPAANPLRAAIALRKEALSGERFGQTVVPAALPHFVLATVLAERGEFAEAMSEGEVGLRIAQTAGHAYSDIWSRYGLGYAHLRQGDFEAAIRILEPGLKLCREMEIHVAMPFVTGALGSAYLWSGRVEAATPLLEESVEAYSAGLLHARRCSNLTFLGEAYLAAGRTTEARERAEQAVALGQLRQQRSNEAWALKLLGDVGAQELLSAHQTTETYRQTLALGTELGMRPLVAHCHFALGKLRTESRAHEKKNEHLEAAGTLYREMDMQFWLTKVEVEMQRLG